jgi:molybdenum cofactor synthesis domain-containing protein
MTEFDLLRKTELKIDNILLDRANLNDIAAAAAEILELPEKEVLVVDYQNRTLVLDILNTCVNAYNIVGKKSELLEALTALPGVSVSIATTVSSNGMLGWIAMDKARAVTAVKTGEAAAAEIRRNIARRVAVFASGAEVLKNEIEDTNTPAIKTHFEAHGYRVIKAGVLPDDKARITDRLREAAETGGYGLIITTGGVGAEAKDQTVEAIKALDPGAATPYICRFEIGTGRHVKDGVKIAVGRFSDTAIIALPGPNDEVVACLSPILEGLQQYDPAHDLAERIAATLRQILRRKMQNRKGKHSHASCQLHLPNRRDEMHGL